MSSFSTFPVAANRDVRIATIIIKDSVTIRRVAMVNEVVGLG